jgi:general secretion pathway protein I
VYKRVSHHSELLRNAARENLAFAASTTSRGFTLLEILVAFTIMAVLLTALLQVFSSGVRAARLGEQYTHAALLAQSTMAFLEADEDGLSLGEHAGRFDDTYQWRSQVSAYLTDAYPRLEELGVPVYPVTATIEVTWQTGGRQRSVLLRTMRLVPLP